MRSLRCIFFPQRVSGLSGRFFRLCHLVAQRNTDIIWQRGRKYVFSIPLTAGGSRDRQKGVLHLAKRIGIKRIAIISLTELVAREAFLGAQEWVKKLGLKVVLSER